VWRGFIKADFSAAVEMTIYQSDVSPAAYGNYSNAIVLLNLFRILFEKVLYQV
jgi:hypothetical protein